MRHLVHRELGSGCWARVVHCMFGEKASQQDKVATKHIHGSIVKCNGLGEKERNEGNKGRGKTYKAWFFEMAV